jgi:hypothetical protein
LGQLSQSKRLAGEEKNGLQPAAARRSSITTLSRFCRRASAGIESVPPLAMKRR